MFAAGRSYGRYAETINSIAAARPLIKKQLTAAWDLAFCWLSDEPHQHHPAMPRSVLLAACSLSLMWGKKYVNIPSGKYIYVHKYVYICVYTYLCNMDEYRYNAGLS